MEYLFHLDPDRCIGCHTCVAACLDENDIKPDVGVPWRRLMISESGKHPHTHLVNFSLACMHCSDPPCMAVCPEGAIQQHANGVVTIDKTLCSGCKACRAVCPFGVPQFDDKGKMQKCDGCLSRLKQGRPPACVEACPLGVIEFQAKIVPQEETIWIPLVSSSQAANK